MSKKTRLSFWYACCLNVDAIIYDASLIGYADGVKNPAERGSGQLAMEVPWIENVLLKRIGAADMEANVRMCMTGAAADILHLIDRTLISHKNVEKEKLMEYLRQIRATISPCQLLLKASSLMLCLLLISLCLQSDVYAQGSVVSEKSKVVFGGRLHAQFHTSNVNNISHSSSFFIRRARLGAEYENASGTMEAEVQYDLGEGQGELMDGFVDLKLSPTFKLKMGQYKKPFSLWEQTSSTKVMVIERGNAVIGTQCRATNQLVRKDGLYAGRDIGITVHGESENVEYHLGVFNGNGSHQESDDDNGKLIAGRIVIQALEDLAFGASIANRIVSNYEDPVKGDIGKTHFLGLEVDLDYGIKHKVSKSGFWVQSEFVYGGNPRLGEETKFMGFAFIGSYNIRLAEGGRFNSIRPACRFDYAKQNIDNDDTANILFTPGLDIFLDTFNRVQINLDISKSQMNGADTELGLRIQFQMHI